VDFRSLHPIFFFFVLDLVWPLSAVSALLGLYSVHRVHQWGEVLQLCGVPEESSVLPFNWGPGEGTRETRMNEGQIVRLKEGMNGRQTEGRNEGGEEADHA